MKAALPEVFCTALRRDTSPRRLLCGKSATHFYHVLGTASPAGPFLFARCADHQERPVELVIERIPKEEYLVGEVMSS